MEPVARELIKDEDVERESGIEKNDVYHVINICREHKKDITADQAAVFLGHVSEESNRTLFLGDVGQYLRDFTAEGMMKIIEACKHNKSKRSVVENLAKFLPGTTTDEEKEQVCALITSGFERNKAKKL